jgi:tripartite-type tricarboxylate transporter receptor subunit TctC
MSSLAARAVAGLLTLGAVWPACAQQFPAKPVRFLVPFAPGGSTDIVARILGQKLTERWGHPVIVDNRAGAAGNIAAETTARAAPDGYTIFQINVASAIAVSLYKNLRYDPVKDFAPVTQLASVALFMVIHPAVKARTVQELIALAKSQPGKLNYASSGNGGPTHLAMELFKTMTATDMVHVPYGGGGPALNDLLANQVQIFMVAGAAIPHINSGRLRALGVSSLKRNRQLPDVPTIAESGVPGYESSPWYGVVVPAHTPRSIVVKLSADIVNILKQADVAERLNAQGMDLVGNTPEQFSEFIKTEIVKWRRIVKASGVKLD